MIGRRAWLGGLLAMTFPGLGGQQPPPQNASPAGQLTPGVTPGVSGQVVASRVFIIGARGELFVYAPTLGPGNLVASIATSLTTADPAGNAVVQGITSYTGSGSVWFANSLEGGNLAFFFATSAAGPYSLTAEITVNSLGSVLLQTGTSNGSWPQPPPSVSGADGIAIVATLAALGLVT